MDERLVIVFIVGVVVIALCVYFVWSIGRLRKSRRWEPPKLDR
jgi:hypothetical protein